MIEPYYSEPGIDLYLGDIREIAPGLGRFQLCIADPPYGINLTATARNGWGSSNQGRVTKWTGHDYDKKPWDSSHFARVRNAADEQVFWGGNYFADILPASASWLVWDKDNTGDFADCELAWTSHKTAARLLKYRWNGMLQEPGQPREPRIYPGQKPVALMRWVLSLFAKEGDRILDPCCGSGPVLQACKERGLPAVGVDISERALDLTIKRLQQEVLAF